MIVWVTELPAASIAGARGDLNSQEPIQIEVLANLG